VRDDEAHSHPWLDRFWTIVDVLVIEEPTMAEHLAEADRPLDGP
jgi:hypothetical protein